MNWSGDFAYATGLITTDGNLSPDGRHISLVSKDREQIENFKRILKLQNKISLRSSTFSKTKKYYSIQFGNVKLYRFYLAIGLHPNKSRTLSEILIPDRYFADFLRGHLDGDGCTVSFWDKVWKSSFRLYLRFISASREHVEWLSRKIDILYHIHGSIRSFGRTRRTIYQLEYGKRSSQALINKMYHGDNITYLKRKKFKIDQALGIIRHQAGMLKLVDRHA